MSAFLPKKNVCVLGVVFTTIAKGPAGGLPPSLKRVLAFSPKIAVPNFVPYLGKQPQYPV